MSTALLPLLAGDLELEGRIVTASNATFYGAVRSEHGALPCVYKPVAGERPLWDFPNGTLARREVAAYVVSEALGWGIVPPTVLRDGPAGSGMVQAWREPDAAQDPVDIVPRGQATPGFLSVLDAVDDEGREVSLVHEDSGPLRRMAVFDVLVNNADRKGGHVLAMPGGHRHGVDHGVCFHVENKLRTVLWGWAQRPLHPDDAREVERFLADLTTSGSELCASLSELLDVDEVHALTVRSASLLVSARMPLPSGSWPAIPWPAF